MKSNTGGQMWLQSPYQTLTTTGSIQGVWVSEGDEVEWIWTHVPSGSYVSGYTVKRKPVKEVFGKEER